MIFRDRLDRTAEPRAKALQSAMELRDCSLRTATSLATRRACRTLMREQANIWRRMPAPPMG